MFSKILLALIVFLAIIGVFLFSENFFQQTFSVIVTGATCSRAQISSNPSEYYLQCDVPLNETNCQNPKIVNFSEDYYLFNSLTNWIPYSGAENCNIISSSDLSLQFQCSMPQEFQSYCQPNGTSGFGIHQLVTYKATLNYGGCYSGTNVGVQTNYRPVGEIVCSSDAEKQCLENHSFQILESCTGTLNICKSGQCTIVECISSTNCPVDTCAIDYSCSNNSCVQKTIIPPLSPCEGATYLPDTCTWDSSTCIQPECTTNSDCALDTCDTDYACVEQKCVGFSIETPPIPCIGATFLNEPVCNWDTSTCIQPECNTTIDCVQPNCLGASASCENNKCVVIGQCVECLNASDCRALPTNCIGSWACNQNNCNLTCETIEELPQNGINELFLTIIGFLQGLLNSLINFVFRR